MASFLLLTREAGEEGSNAVSNMVNIVSTLCQSTLRPFRAPYSACSVFWYDYLCQHCNSLVTALKQRCGNILEGVCGCA